MAQVIDGRRRGVTGAMRPRGGGSNENEQVEDVEVASSNRYKAQKREKKGQKTTTAATTTTNGSILPRNF